MICLLFLSGATLAQERGRLDVQIESQQKDIVFLKNAISVSVNSLSSLMLLQLQDLRTLNTAFNSLKRNAIVFIF